MAKRRLATVDLGEELQQKLLRTGLTTVQDVLDLPLLDVMKRLRLSADQSRTLQRRLCQECAPRPTTVWSLLQQRRADIPLGHPHLDRLLGGGLLHGSLTELAGPAGVGKTQWCIEATARCLLRDPLRPTPVIYIDTEAAFTPSRLVEVLTARLEEENQQRLPLLLGNVSVHQPDSVSSLDYIIGQLEVEAAEGGAGLVIVDSIASLARKEYLPLGGEGGGGAWKRVLLMGGWASRLKTVAHNMSIVVLVTNQVTSRTLEYATTPGCDAGAMDEDYGNCDSIETNTINTDNLNIPTGISSSCPSNRDNTAVARDRPGDRVAAAGAADIVQSCHVVVPAMGNTWTHFVNTRLVLQYTGDPNVRQLVVAKSPVAPFASFNYSIDGLGVALQDSSGRYSYRGSDPGLHRIRVESGTPV